MKGYIITSKDKGMRLVYDGSGFSSNPSSAKLFPTHRDASSEWGYVHHYDHSRVGQNCRVMPIEIPDDPEDQTVPDIDLKGLEQIDYPIKKKTGYIMRKGAIDVYVGGAFIVTFPDEDAANEAGYILESVILHQRSFLQRKRDKRGMTHQIFKRRGERNFLNPLHDMRIRRWARSIQGRQFYRKLSVFNTLHPHD